MVISEKILNDLAVDESCKTPAEEELLLKNTVFESSLAANSTSGVDGIITHANAVFMETWGYDSLEEVVGRPIPYFFVNPDDALPILDSLNKTSKWEGNFLAKRKDGSTFIAQSLASVIRNEKGELTGYQSSVIDITERKQIENALQKSEEKYRNLTESFSELIYRADPETLVATYVNQAVKKIYGHTVEEWLNDPNLWEQTIYPDDRERAFAEFTELQTKLESGIVEYRIIKKDKTIRWVQDHVSWEKDQQGKPNFDEWNKL